MEETALPAYFGEWLKFRRKQLDLTQVELAQRVGCSSSALRKIETGERRPSKQLAGLLAKSLDIPSEEQTTFIRVARGELELERLHSSKPFRPADRLIDQDFFIEQSDLPYQSTTFVGREVELAALGNLLVDPQCRLLTITGMGGIGKTRLAIALASHHQGSFPGGVYFVSLASLNAPEFITLALADSLRLTFTGPLEPREQLLNYLAMSNKQAILLILDNLEHLLVEVNPRDTRVKAEVLLAEILRRAPNIKILVTSRERINLQGEWTFELHGMPFPMEDQSSHLENYSASALFIQRVRQVKNNFELLPDEQQSLAKVCRLVEGSPLAIELAAAWAGMLSIHEIAREIETNLDFLTSFIRDIPERQRSLRATFEHSWNLLSVEEQQGLSKLAVFRGGFRREAAEKVAGASLATLMSLFTKSLLLRKENNRYDLHEVVRQYAFSHVLDDQKDITRDRHCKYYLELVRGEGKGFSEANQWVGDRNLVDELDNLRTAMSWGLKSSQVTYTLQIATALGQFWYVHGYWREGMEWLDWGLTCPEPIPNIARAKALTVAGRLARYLGDYVQAVAMLRESLVLWEKCDDQTGIAQTLCNLGAAVFRLGEYESAMDLLEKALNVAIQQGDRRGRYCSLENLGHAASRQGKSQTAIKLYNEALAFAQEANDENQVAHILNAIGDEYMIVRDFDRAENHFSKATEICQKLGNRLILAFVSANRGLIAIKKGNYTGAFDLLAEAILVMQEMGGKEEVILCFETMALMALEQRYPVRSARLLGASEALRKALGVIRSKPLQEDFDACMARVRSQLDETLFNTAWAEGSTMNYEQAVVYAVEKS